MPEPPPDADQLRLPRRPPLASPLIAVLLLACLALAVLAVLLFAGGSEPAIVPDLSGLSVAQARAQAEGAGLRLLAAAEGQAAGVDLVVSQEPAAGRRVAEGTTIHVLLSGPARQRQVPEVTGLNLEDARGKLQEAGLSLGKQREEASSAELAGMVVRQRPEPGQTVPDGGEVELWLGVAGVETPDLFGKPEAEAQAAAAGAGLLLEFLYEPTDEGLPGRVFRQSPQAGSIVPPGSRVVAVVNGSAADGAQPATPLFAALARRSPFPVLAPDPASPWTPVPEGPQWVAGEGEGFELSFVDPQRPGAALTLFEGNWFEPGEAVATSVEIRGRPAVLDDQAGQIVLYWEESGTYYAVRATGVGVDDVTAFALRLRPVSPPGGVE